MPLYGHRHACPCGRPSSEGVQSSSASSRPSWWIGIGTRRMPPVMRAMDARVPRVDGPIRCLRAPILWEDHGHPSRHRRHASDGCIQCAHCLHPCNVRLRALPGLPEGLACEDQGSSGRTPPISFASGVLSRMPTTLVTMGLHGVLDGRRLGTHLRAPPQSARVEAVAYGVPSLAWHAAIGLSGPGFRHEPRGLARTHSP
jgi:hypothetical protein